MAADEKPPPTFGSLLWDFFTSLVAPRQAQAVAILASAIVLGAVGVVWAQSTSKEYIKAQVKEEVAQLHAESVATREKVESLAEDLRSLKRAADGESQRNADRFEVLYRVTLTGQPSRKAEELSRPAPSMDGGR